MAGLCAERSSTAFLARDDLDGEVDLARHRDGDERRSSAIAAVGVLTVVSRTKPVIAASDWRSERGFRKGVRPGRIGRASRARARRAVTRPAEGGLISI